jgi:hypothetical protein
MGIWTLRAAAMNLLNIIRTRLVQSISNDAQTQTIYSGRQRSVRG